MYSLTDELMRNMFIGIKEKYDNDKKMGGRFRDKNNEIINSSIMALEYEKYICNNLDEKDANLKELRTYAILLKKLKEHIKKNTKKITKNIMDEEMLNYYNTNNIERTSKQCMAYFLRVHMPYFISDLYIDKFLKLLKIDAKIDDELTDILNENVVGTLCLKDGDLDYNDYFNLKENICFIIWITKLYNNASIDDIYKLSNTNKYINDISLEDEAQSFRELYNKTKSITYASNNYETSLFNIIYNYFKLDNSDLNIDLYKESTCALNSLINSDIFKQLEHEEIAKLIYYFSRYNKLDVIISKENYSFKDLTPLSDMIIRRKKEMNSSYLIDKLFHDIASGKISIKLNDINKSSVKKINYK